MAGQVVTFYSYKGGVGRSFALANIAAVLSGWGYRVLCVDWDLDAPGLRYYFEPWLAAPLRGGVVDAFADFAAGAPLDLERFIVTVHSPAGGSQFDFIPAGADGPGYFAKTQGLDWSRLYSEQDLGQRLEELRANWMSRYDVVLIDSRTGITDIGGICTAQLPDVLVMLFTANKQSLGGTLDVAGRARAARDKLPYDRAGLLIVPVPSRFDVKEEFRRAEQWRETFNRDLADVVAPWLHREITVANLLTQVTIPYIPYWSFGEEIAVGQADPAPGDIAYILTTLAALLAHALSRTELLGENRDSYVSAAARGALSRPQDRFSYDILLSYEKEQDGDFAQLFAGLLRTQGLRVFDWPAMYRQGSVQDAVARCHHCVAITVPGKTGPRPVDTFLRQSLDDSVPRQVFRVAPGSAEPASAATRSMADTTEALPARTYAEAALAAARISALIRLSNAEGYVQALLDASSADGAAAKLAYEQVADCYAKLGDLARDAGALDEAGGYYAGGQAAAAQAGSKPREASALRALGEVSFRQREYGNAGYALTRALQIFHELGDDEAVADVLFSLGDTLRTTGRLAEATAAYEEAIAAYEARAADPVARRRLGLMTTHLGDIAVAAGRTEEAFARYEAAVRLTRAAIDDEPNDDELKQDLFDVCSTLGELALSIDANTMAQLHFEAAADVAAWLLAYPVTDQMHQNSYYAHSRLGLIATRVSDWKSARDHFGLCRGIAADCVSSDRPSQEWQGRLAAAYGNLGAVAMQTGNYPEAKAQFLAQFEIVAALASADPGDPERNRDLMHGYRSLGDVAVRLGDTASARENYQSAVSIAQRMSVTDRANYAQWDRDKSLLNDRLRDLA